MPNADTMLTAFRAHWPEYVIEALGLGLFMVSAGLFTTAIEYPGSPIHEAIADPLARRALVGLAMGVTAVAIIYSPWGMRSGAHINPAVTLTFYRLGKVEAEDAIWYVAAQFFGAVAGVLLVAQLIGPAFDSPPVNHVATLPGPRGPAVAFIAELVISLLLMGVILILTNSAGLGKYTGLAAGSLVAVYISVEGPLSGMSMNPARTFGSALEGRLWTALWVYFTAPPLGMLTAAELFVRVRGLRAVRCAKLHHHNSQRCIFRCGYREAQRNEPLAVAIGAPTGGSAP